MTAVLVAGRDRQGTARARQAVLSSRNRFWRSSDFQLGPSTVQHLLGDLEARGELRRIRRGLYWRGAMTPLGMAPPSPERLVEAIAPGAGVGLSGLSAANALRLSTQVPRRLQIAVPERAPSDAGGVQFVSRAARTGRAAEHLTSTEVAILEVLDDWPAVVEVESGRATRQLTELLRSGAIRAERLADAAATEPGQVRSRLRALLTAAGRPDLVHRVPVADRRTETTALATLAFA